VASEHFNGLDALIRGVGGGTEGNVKWVQGAAGGQEGKVAGGVAGEGHPWLPLNAFANFQEAARYVGSLVETDKVWQEPCPSPTGCHDYHHAYGVYLMPIRHHPMVFLEIGLGCNMKYVYPNMKRVRRRSSGRVNGARAIL
jgi:hypothetical protein